MLTHDLKVTKLDPQLLTVDMYKQLSFYMPSHTGTHGAWVRTLTLWVPTRPVSDLIHPDIWKCRQQAL